MTHLVHGDKYTLAGAPEDLSRRVERHARIAQFALALLFLSWFGFVAADRTGFGQHEGILANHVLRVSGWALATSMVLASSLYHRIYFSLPPILKYLIGLHLLVLLLLIISDFAGASVSLTSYFRICEWLAIFYILSQAFAKAEGAQASIIEFSKTLFFLLIAIIFIYFFVFSDSVVTQASDRLQIGGTAIHPNRLAFVAACGIALFGLFFRNSVDALGLLLSLALTFAAASRVGYVLAAVALTFVIVSRLSGRSRVLFLFYAALAFLAAALILLEYREIAIWLLSDSQYATLNGRIEVWKAALQLIAESPLIGWGFIEGPKLVGSLVEQPWWNPTNAQNELLSAGVSGGLIGMGALLALYLVLARQIASMQSGNAKLYVSALCVLYLIASQFEPFLVHHATQAVLFLLLALMLEAQKNIPAPLERPHEPDKGSNRP